MDFDLHQPAALLVLGPKADIILSVLELPLQSNLALEAFVILLNPGISTPVVLFHWILLVLFVLSIIKLHLSLTTATPTALLLLLVFQSPTTVSLPSLSQIYTPLAILV